MVGRFAAVVVEEHRLAQRARHQPGRQRRQQERRVRRREDVDDVGPPQLAPQQRPVGQLRHSVRT